MTRLARFLGRCAETGCAPLGRARPWACPTSGVSRWIESWPQDVGRHPGSHARWARQEIAFRVASAAHAIDCRRAMDRLAGAAYGRINPDGSRVDARSQDHAAGLPLDVAGSAERGRGTASTARAGSRWWAAAWAGRRTRWTAGGARARTEARWASRARTQARWASATRAGHATAASSAASPAAYAATAVRKASTTPARLAWPALAWRSLALERFPVGLGARTLDTLSASGRSPKERYLGWPSGISFEPRA